MAAGMLTQGYLLCAGLMSLPLAIAAEQRGRLIDRIRASERLFRRNFTESLVGMLLLRREGARLEIVDLNDTAARLVGSEQADLVGSSLGDLLDTPERLDLVAERMLAGNLEGWKAQTGLRDREGARVNVALSLLARDPHPMFAAQLLDVTSEYDARRRVEQAEKLTSATLDTTVCIILVTDLDGTIVRVNSATSELTGYAEDGAARRPVWETSIAPSTAADVEALLLRPDGSGSPTMREADAITKRRRASCGSSGTATSSATSRTDPMYAVMTGIDVTAERTTSGLIVHLLEAAITTALIGIDNAGRITVFNAGAQNLLGFQYREMIGEPFVRILEPDELLARTGACGDEALRGPDRHDRARGRGPDAGLDLGVEGRHGGTRSR